MKISARNQLPGAVTSVDKGGVMATVKIRLAGGQEIVAVITREAVETLQLGAGDEVVALIKSTEVMVAKE